MLPAQHRVRRREDFAHATRGARSGSRLMVVHARASQPTVPVGRVGCVVSKAVGNAVVRNRVTRRLRAASALLLNRIPPGYDVVVRARPAAAEATYAELSADLVGLTEAALTRAVRRSGR